VEGKEGRRNFQGSMGVGQTHSWQRFEIAV
jgi:hypothetical protein